MEWIFYRKLKAWLCIVWKWKGKRNKAFFFLFNGKRKSEHWKSKRVRCFTLKHHRNKEKWFIIGLFYVIEYIEIVWHLFSKYGYFGLIFFIKKVKIVETNVKFQRRPSNYLSTLSTLNNPSPEFFNGHKILCIPYEQTNSYLFIC